MSTLQTNLSHVSPQSIGRVAPIDAKPVTHETAPVPDKAKSVAAKLIAALPSKTHHPALTFAVPTANGVPRSQVQRQIDKIKDEAQMQALVRLFQDLNHRVPQSDVPKNRPLANALRHQLRDMALASLEYFLTELRACEQRGNGDAASPAHLDDKSIREIRQIAATPPRDLLQASSALGTLRNAIGQLVNRLAVARANVPSTRQVPPKFRALSGLRANSAPAAGSRMAMRADRQQLEHAVERT